MTIQIPERITVKDLAEAIGQRPVRVVADIFELGQLKFPGDALDFEMAANIAQKHGFDAEKKR